MKNKTALNTIALLLVVMMLQISAFAGELEVKGKINVTDTSGSGTNPVELSHDDGGAFGLKIKTQGGELDIGPANIWSTCHYYTDQGVHWFNNQLEIQTGILRAYSTSNISLKTNGTTHLFIKILLVKWALTQRILPLNWMWRVGSVLRKTWHLMQ